LKLMVEGSGHRTILLKIEDLLLHLAYHCLTEAGFKIL